MLIPIVLSGVLDSLANAMFIAATRHGRLDVAAVLSRAEIDQLCSLDIHFAHVDSTFRKLGLES